MSIVLSSSLNRWDVFVLRKRLAACLAGVLRQVVLLVFRVLVGKLVKAISSQQKGFQLSLKELSC